MVNGLPDRSEVVFDDERVVVNAGVVLAVAVGRRLGIEALVDDLRGYIDQLKHDQDQARRHELRESISLQWWGTGLFLIGAMLAGIANAVC